MSFLTELRRRNVISKLDAHHKDPSDLRWLNKAGLGVIAVPGTSCAFCRVC